ncbi:MAG: phosphate/phosphite/phosphonate ABC transporter substrate-binding protein [Elainellaceae cyanobacterium]
MSILSSSRLKPIALMLGLGLTLSPWISACNDNRTINSTKSISPNEAENPVRVGVLVIDSIEATRERYGPLLSELSAAIDKPVVFVSLPQESQFDMVKAGKVDFVIANPLASVQIRRLYNTEFLATISLQETGPEFGGLIVVRPDSPITSIADLRGKKGMCVSMRTAAAGCLFQLYHLQQKDVDPFEISNNILIEENPSQDKIVQAVIDGETDFGFVRTGQLERMIKRGLLSSSDEVRVLEPIQDDFTTTRTTQLYPTWAVAALEDTPEALVEQMRQAMLDIPAGHEALAASGFEQLISPVDYSQIDVLIESLNLPSAEVQ